MLDHCFGWGGEVKSLNFVVDDLRTQVGYCHPVQTHPDMDTDGKPRCRVQAQHFPGSSNTLLFTRDFDPVLMNYFIFQEFGDYVRDRCIGERKLFCELDPGNWAIMEQAEQYCLHVVRLDQVDIAAKKVLRLCHENFWMGNSSHCGNNYFFNLIN